MLCFGYDDLYNMAKEYDELKRGTGDEIWKVGQALTVKGFEG